MANTLTRVEVKKAAQANENSRKNTRPAPIEEQPQHSSLLWLVAPLTLLATACAAFLVVSRWLNNSDDNDYPL